MLVDHLFGQQMEFNDTVLNNGLFSSTISEGKPPVSKKSKGKSNPKGMHNKAKVKNKIAKKSKKRNRR